MLRRKRTFVENRPIEQESACIDADSLAPTSSKVLVETNIKEILEDSDDEATKLEKYVLGGEEEFIKRLNKWEKEESSSSDDEAPVEEKIEKLSDFAPNPSNAKKKQAAWVDEDDNLDITVKKSRRLAKIAVTECQTIDAQRYSERLKQSFEKSVGVAVPKWADSTKPKNKRLKKSASDDDSDEDEDSDLLRRTGNYIGTSLALPKETLHFKRVSNLTDCYKIQAVIKNTEFLKQASVLLVSGYTQRIMLFQIDGDDNSLLKTVQFDSFPIDTARFSADGERVIVGSSLHSHFFYYDMLADQIVKVPRNRCFDQQKMGRFSVSPNGNIIAFAAPNGQIHLLSARTYDYISTLKMNGGVSAMTFSAYGDNLYTHGDDGEVYVWDVRRRECVHKFFDDGCLKGTSLAVSANDSYLACGSSSGVVNLYDLHGVTDSTRPKPLKSILNLTTWTNDLSFNANNEILSMCSNSKDNAVRMFHVSSKSTFKNFPNEREKLGRVECLNFSVNGGYFCCGTSTGHVFLYRIFHYDKY